MRSTANILNVTFERDSEGFSVRIEWIGPLSGEERHHDLHFGPYEDANDAERRLGKALLEISHDLFRVKDEEDDARN